MQFPTWWQCKYTTVGAQKNMKREQLRQETEERKERPLTIERPRGRGEKKGVWLVPVSKQVQHTEEEGKEGRKKERGSEGLVTMATLHYSWDSSRRSAAVLAFGLSSDSINKEVVCIIRAYWLPRETEEKEPMLFGRLWFVVGWSN